MYNQNVQDPKVWITRRINMAKSELKEKGGDYYEGRTRQNFLDGLDTVVDRISDADKKLKFAEAVNQYRKMAPPDNTKVSSNDEDILNTAKKEIEKKELTTKPNKKFNTRTGRLEDINTKNLNGQLAMTPQERKEYKELQKEFPGAFLDENMYEITIENIEKIAKANKRVHPSTSVIDRKDMLLENELKLCEVINKKIENYLELK